MSSDRIETLLDESLREEEACEEEEGGLGQVREEDDPDVEEGVHPRADELPDPDTAAPDAAAPQVQLTTIGDILGVPLWYERTGTPGPRRFPVAPRFVPLLEQTVRATTNRAPRAFGRLERIVTAGLFVDKGGAHGQGRACDWDRLVFEQVQIAPRDKDHLSSSAATRQRYWAFAAICRSVASPALHGAYDDGPHDDHIHLADNMTFPFDAKKSAVTLVQSLVNELFEQSPPLSVDGRFGPKTSAALSSALERLRLSGTVDDPLVWRQFLRRCGRLGFVMSVRQ